MLGRVSLSPTYCCSHRARPVSLTYCRDHSSSQWWKKTDQRKRSVDAATASAYVAQRIRQGDGLLVHDAVLRSSGLAGKRPVSQLIFRKNSKFSNFLFYPGRSTNIKYIIVECHKALFDYLTALLIVVRTDLILVTFGKKFVQLTHLTKEKRIFSKSTILLNRMILSSNIVCVLFRILCVCVCVLICIWFWI